MLLYNYGGCWFDLDCFFLRSFDPIFKNYEKEICVYTWELQNYPNGAIFISLESKSDKMKNVINFIIDQGNGWGFQEANIHYDLPLDMVVLPCSWFDASWLPNPDISFDDFFESTDKTFDFNNFYCGAFCYHWHNRWKKDMAESSIIKQLTSIIQTNISSETV